MNMNNKGLFTSNTPEWETPQDLFDSLNAEFEFVLDVCATFKNRKCPAYLNKELNGLTTNWDNWGGV